MHIAERKRSLFLRKHIFVLHHQDSRGTSRVHPSSSGLSAVDETLQTGSALPTPCPPPLPSSYPLPPVSVSAHRASHLAASTPAHRHHHRRRHSLFPSILSVPPAVVRACPRHCLAVASFPIVLVSAGLVVAPSLSSSTSTAPLHPSASHSPSRRGCTSLAEDVHDSCSSLALTRPWTADPLSLSNHRRQHGGPRDERCIQPLLNPG